MPTFPSYANLLHSPYTEHLEPAVQRTEMESGPPKQSKVKSRVLVAREVTYAFGSLSDYQSFKTWFRDDVARGASWFDWRDPVDDTVKSARIVGGMLEPAEPNKRMDVWTVKFRIETWDG